MDIVKRDCCIPFMIINVNINTPFTFYELFLFLFFLKHLLIRGVNNSQKYNYSLIFLITGDKNLNIFITPITSWDSQ